jgi:hypothetical protein
MKVPNASKFELFGVADVNAKSHITLSMDVPELFGKEPDTPEPLGGAALQASSAPFGESVRIAGGVMTVVPDKNGKPLASKTKLRPLVIISLSFRVKTRSIIPARRGVAKDIEFHDIHIQILHRPAWK